MQFDEVRDLGTGYFAFSTSEREREKQKEDLTDIREETLSARDKAERIKAKRAEMMKARLAKVKVSGFKKQGRGPIVAKCRE